MKVVERSAIVPFTPAQMYALVNDVARYPEFLPWCSASRVEDLAGDERVASLTIRRGVLNTEFTTRNRLQRDSEIMMSLVEGPFRSLSGQWRFSPIGDRGARVSFRVEFEFRNPLTAAAFNAMFESLCGTIVDAFVARARQIYV
ncbi:MAG: type II toxin-antitoxin system RatA family toxin [Steroidobacterales bacterium]